MWQLSETKIVASVHVWVSKNVEYMKVAGDIRAVLHAHGVHSCTIQPEFSHVVQGGAEFYSVSNLLFCQTMDRGLISSAHVIEALR